MDRGSIWRRGLSVDKLGEIVLWYCVLVYKVMSDFCVSDYICKYINYESCLLHTAFFVLTKLVLSKRHQYSGYIYGSVKDDNKG